MIDALMLRNWLQKKKQLDALKEEEMALRKLIAEQFFADSITRPGTYKTIFQNTFDIKAVVDEYVSVKKPDVMANIKELTDQEKECIEWKPEVKKRNFKKLPKTALLRAIVSVKPSSPKLEIIDMEIL